MRDELRTVRIRTDRWCNPGNKLEPELCYAKEASAVTRLLALHGGNLARAARATKMGRSHLRELARRYGVPTRGSTVGVPDDDEE